MKSTALSLPRWVPVFALALALPLAGRSWAAAPEAPKVSTFAPAADLAAQLDEYIAGIEKSLADPGEFGDAQAKVAREANTLILIALALGLHDTDNAYKAAAPALVDAARQLAAAKDYAAAKQGLAALQAAKTAQAGQRLAALKWEKLASIEDLMKQVPLVNTRMKRMLKGAKFQANAQDTAGHSAVLAVIAQGAMADTSHAENPVQVEQWYKFCSSARSAAAALNQAIHAKDETAAAAAQKRLAQCCDDCHAVFQK